MRRSLALIAPLLCLPLLAACQVAPAPSAATRAEASAPTAPASLPAASEGGCWTTDRVPALTETVYVADASGARQPQTRELRPAEERLFAVPCAREMTPELIASLQRALNARGLYAGAVSGAMDAETVAAVRRYQAPLGLDSGVLSLDAAQQLGLIAVGRAAF